MKIGDVVLVHDDTPRINWKLAVVEELIVGNDGLVRAAHIRTAQGRTNRPISKLCPLEVSSEEPQPETVVQPDSTKTDAEAPMAGKLSSPVLNDVPRRRPESRSQPG